LNSFNRAVDAEIRSKQVVENKSPLSTNPEKWSAIRETIKSEGSADEVELKYEPP
jgi:hypothetical protein